MWRSRIPTSDEELKFIAGRFFDLDIPKEKRYLLKYFTTEGQQRFLKYYLAFGFYTFFMEHTGYRFRKRWLRYLKRRFNLLEKVHREAKEAMNLDLLVEIESGKYKIPGKYKI